MLPQEILLQLLHKKSKLYVCGDTNLLYLSFCSLFLLNVSVIVIVIVICAPVVVIVIVIVQYFSNSNSNSNISTSHVIV